MDKKTLKQNLKRLQESRKSLEDEISRITEQIKVLEKIERKGRQSQYQKQKAIEENLVAPWVQSHIDTGDLIRVKGSNDPSIRQVVYMDKQCIITQCVRLNDRNEVIPLYKNTHHSFSKVTQVMRDGHWYKIKDLVK